MLEDIMPPELREGDCLVTQSGMVFRMIRKVEENEKFCQWEVEPVRYQIGRRMTLDKERDMLKVIR